MAKIIKIDFSVRGKGLHQLLKDRKQEKKEKLIEQRMERNLTTYG